MPEWVLKEQNCIFQEALQLHLGEEKPPQPTASLDVQETSHIPENGNINVCPHTFAGVRLHLHLLREAHMGNHAKLKYLLLSPPPTIDFLAMKIGFALWVISSDL